MIKAPFLRRYIYMGTGYWESALSLEFAFVYLRFLRPNSVLSSLWVLSASAPLLHGIIRSLAQPPR